MCAFFLRDINVSSPHLKLVFIIYLKVLVAIFKCLAHSKHLKYYLNI